MWRSGIRLPSTSGARGADSFLKLLRSVDPQAENGFGFEGCILRRDQHHSRADLRPAADYPEIPILLEYSQTAAHGINGHRRRDSLYVLWRFQPRTGEWIELGRSVSAAWEWAIDLRPLALRALAEARGQGCATEIALDLDIIAARISDFIDKELLILTPLHRSRALAMLHDDLAARSSANMCMMGRRAA